MTLWPVRLVFENIKSKGLPPSDCPFAPSELVADSFELARDIREVDMRASPYDLRALGFAPIPIETPEGRADYERRQRAFSARGEPLRARLLALVRRLQAG